MPALDTSVPRYPIFKLRVSEPVFYIPAIFMWLALSVRHRCLTLPCAANPGLEVGGLWGESKAQGMEQFGPTANKWLAPWAVAKRGAGDVEADVEYATCLMESAGLSFPIVAKPDVGYQGWGVRKVRDRAELAAYIRTFPDGGSILLQHLIPHQAEAGIFYVRRPGEQRGKIISMALTYGPHVVGDGISTVAELILSDPILKKRKDLYLSDGDGDFESVPRLHEPVRLSFCASARMGSVYRDAGHLVTTALTERIDEISRDIAGFHFGRFDVRFRSVDDLLAGRDFSIIELNGAGAEVLHIWDGRVRTLEAYRALWRQYREAFEIGASNRKQGHRAEGLWGMISRQRYQSRLRKAYPPAN